MKKETTSITEELFCDHCGKSEVLSSESLEKTSWYEVKVMSRLGSRMYTTDKVMIERTIQPYVSSKHFCSKSCAVNYLSNDVELFVQEIKPPENRSRKQVSLN